MSYYTNESMFYSQEYNQTNENNLNEEEQKKHRKTPLRFKPSIDIALMESTLKYNALHVRYGKTKSTWDAVSSAVNSELVKQQINEVIDARKCQDRIKRLMDYYRENNDQIFKNSTPSEYNKQIELLSKLITLEDDRRRMKRGLPVTNEPIEEIRRSDDSSYQHSPPASSTRQQIAERESDINSVTNEIPSIYVQPPTTNPNNPPMMYQVVPNTLQPHSVHGEGQFGMNMYNQTSYTPSTLPPVYPALTPQSTPVSVQSQPTQPTQLIPPSSHIPSQQFQPLHKTYDSLRPPSQSDMTSLMDDMQKAKSVKACLSSYVESYDRLVTLFEQMVGYSQKAMEDVRLMVKEEGERENRRLMIYEKQLELQQQQLQLSFKQQHHLQHQPQHQHQYQQHQHQHQQPQQLQHHQQHQHQHQNQVPLHGSTPQILQSPQPHTYTPQYQHQSSVQSSFQSQPHSQPHSPQMNLHPSVSQHSPHHSLNTSSAVLSLSNTHLSSHSVTLSNSDHSMVDTAHNLSRQYSDYHSSPDMNSLDDDCVSTTSHAFNSGFNSLALASTPLSTPMGRPEDLNRQTTHHQLHAPIPQHSPLPQPLPVNPAFESGNYMWGDQSDASLQRLQSD